MRSLLGPLCALGLTACGSTPPPAPAPAAPAPLESPCDPVFGAHPTFARTPASLRERGAPAALVEKLRASPYHYFRTLASEFAARSCEAVAGERWHLPLVAVHGDAHVEQLVVTRASYGLEDFDRAGFGPAIVDLVRYAASIHLVCREASFECDGERAVDAYLRAYRSALDHPPAIARPPVVVQRIREEVPRDRNDWLAWTDSVAAPLTGPVSETRRRRWQAFAQEIHEVHPELDARYCEPVRVGALSMGVGSALEAKYLVRARGASDAAEDDVILEARSVARPTGIDCAWRPPHGGSLQALMLMAILGRRMPEIYGFVALDDDPLAPPYWVQSWDPGYRELSIADIESQSELEELAVDAAYQIAGHFWTRFPAPLQANQRLASLDGFDLVEDRARTLARELADEVCAEWDHFRALR